MNEEYTVYSVDMDVLNMETGNILRKDSVTYHLLGDVMTAAEYFAQGIDITNVKVIDENTGKVIWSQFDRN